MFVNKTTQKRFYRGFKLKMNEQQLNIIKKIRAELNKINFEQIIKIANPDKYDYNIYINQQKHYVENEYCTACEHEKINKPANDKYIEEYQLKNISHGAHALDFLQSIVDLGKENDLDLGKEEDLNKYLLSNNWSDTPVLFLMENPAAQKKVGKDYIFAFDKGDKNPSQQWYWIYDGFRQTDLEYPKYFKQNEYGTLIASLICMFKLANAYVTNLVKCGMNKNNGSDYLPTNEYHSACIKTCYKEVLLKEIKCLAQAKNNLIIFAFGNRVYSSITELMNSCEDSFIKKLSYQICLLPHPANHLSNEYRKYVLFGKVYKLLSREQGADQALRMFLEKDNNKFVSFKLNKNELIEKLKDAIKKTGRKESVNVLIKNKRNFENNRLNIFFTDYSLDKENYAEEIRIYVSDKNNKKQLGFGFTIEDDIWIWDYEEDIYYNENEFKQMVNEEIFEAYKAFEQYIYDHKKTVLPNYDMNQ